MGVGLMLVKHPAKVLAHRAEALTKQELSRVNTSITFFPVALCSQGRQVEQRLAGVTE